MVLSLNVKYAEYLLAVLEKNEHDGQKCGKNGLDLVSTPLAISIYSNHAANVLSIPHV